MKVFIGWDGRDAVAYEVCRASLEANSSIPVEVFPLKEWELRYKKLYWRKYFIDENGQRFDMADLKPFSTDFSFTRFLVPHICEYADEMVVFCDPDMVWRGDIAEMIAEIEGRPAVACVKHNHIPSDVSKMGGLVQTQYQRKNWSSLMVMNPSKCRDLTPYKVNNESGSYLHAMVWALDAEIFGLDERWNWLEGHSSPEIDPMVVHYTRGTPDLPGCEDVMYADLWWAWEDRIYE